ncbi:MAG: DUF4340 domain-containing protein, partial [Gammaproteobacteria bacterium]|nr:DUF4340 domain-containing protein [Gammaproteobacteria bacterium]
LEDIERITISGAGAERLVTLERQADGWVVVEQDGYPADFAKVRQLLVGLAEAEIVEEKTANPDFYARLGVEPVATPDAGGLEIGLQTSSGTGFDIVLGAPYGSDERYARIADALQSVLIDRNPDVPREPSQWVVTEIVDIPSSRIRRVEVRHDDGERLVIHKSEPAEANFAVDGVPDGRELQYEGVANVTGNLLSGLSLEQVAAAEGASAGDVPAADDEAAAADGTAALVADFHTFDGLVVTITADDSDPPWLTFRARTDASAELDGESDEDAEAAEAADVDLMAAATEADALNARLAGWRFRIPAYQTNQLARRIDDLLAAVSADE